MAATQVSDLFNRKNTRMKRTPTFPFFKFSAGVSLSSRVFSLQLQFLKSRRKEPEQITSNTFMLQIGSFCYFKGDIECCVKGVVNITTSNFNSAFANYRRHNTRKYDLDGVILGAFGGEHQARQWRILCACEVRDGIGVVGITRVA